MHAARNIYRIVRSVAFTVILFTVGLVSCLYVALSLPWTQRKVLDIACGELSGLLGGRVEAESMTVSLFDEILLRNVSLTSPEGEKCISVGTLGAGIDLRRLVMEGKIEITYAEIIKPDIRLSQAREGASLNIQFMIDALAPKDRTKPPTKFDLNIRTIAIRQGHARFDRLWKPRSADSARVDFNHIEVNDLAVDMSIPRLKNDDFIFNLRRLALTTPEGLVVRRLECVAEVAPQRLALRNFRLETPGSELTLNDQEILPRGGLGHIAEALKEGRFEVTLESPRLTPGDFAPLYPGLRDFECPLALNLAASGNIRDVEVERLILEGAPGVVPPLTLDFRGAVAGLDSVKSCAFAAERFELHASAPLMKRLSNILPLKGALPSMLRSLGAVSVSLKGKGSLASGAVTGDVKLVTDLGSIRAEHIEVRGLAGKGTPQISGEISTDGFNAGTLLPASRLGQVAFRADADVRLSKGLPDGFADIKIDRVVWSGYELADIVISTEKSGKDMSLTLSIGNPGVDFGIDASLSLDGAASRLQAQVDVEEFVPSLMGLLPAWPGYAASGSVDIDVTGNSADNLAGSVDVRDFRFYGDAGQPSLSLPSLHIESDFEHGSGRDISISSDLLDGYVAGHYRFGSIVPAVKGLLSGVLPSLIGHTRSASLADTSFDFDLTLHPDDAILNFFHLPVKPLTDVHLKGSYDGETSMADLTLTAPYLQQGKNKLVSDTSVRVVIDGESGTASADASTVMPVKFGELTLDLNATAHADNIVTSLSWHLPDAEVMSGNLGFDVGFERSPIDRSPDLRINIDRSKFVMNSAEWTVGGGNISLMGKRLDVDRLLVSHGEQFVEIAGTASELPTDSLHVNLANIDLGYIFDTLNINYVTFGGKATGRISASSLFTPDLRAATDRLSVDSLSYNGAVLGNAELESHFDMPAKMVAIGAVIHDTDPKPTIIDGGIWVTRDSLSFDVDANRVNVAFLRPFMAAFSSGLEGRASGHAKLFGTFKDIDLIGRVKADTLRMKLDFTNTWYAGSDSVILDCGKITVPAFRLYDRDGHTGVFSGTLRHKCFREPEFDFRLTEAHDLLCYDTDAKINPDWYGTVYGNGTATITGRPGLVGISIDMTTQPRSAFTLVLNDTQAAEEYRFLSFSDRRRERIEAAMPDTVPEFLKRFRRNVAQEEGPPTEVALDIRATVTPGALLTLVMDPAGGDRITARGNGAMQMEYSSESNEMKMFGRYTLDEGNYNFSLQDIILKDFTIRPGSTISFNGDPMNADLDIAATYRVNTNLTDLDVSFATDRDLNRTNVPVDAVLLVRGPMTSPDIDFDIDLPTLTEEVNRKVRSLISTDDMMSRQIIYLLALNRFYTSEYGGSSQVPGSEFSAIASSTLSSQLSNVLSNLTDKLTVSPSIRSDKGNFSDFEMDLALSSRLLNNRLLINGNFGYRDRSTSTTTFVGDFDIEYLLSRSGHLRLKAYNHFNDQNYYLRSALTTQGIGVVFRKEFDNLFSFLRPLRRKKDKEDQSADGASDDKAGAPSAKDKGDNEDEHDAEY
ncbi:MAG: translocation/assembly module TamB domain-containing protein [Muribaculaceae bacterium]|nr:translocation/assembly module TamB domain-containing protein [Muribaculaceae bacterium]